MTLPQSKAAYLNDPKVIVPATIRKLRPPSPTRTLAARTTLPIGSFWHNQAASAVPGRGVAVPRTMSSTSPPRTGSFVPIPS